MLAPGDEAPDFSLPDDSGRTVELGRELESGPVLLYFYPADFTPICTRQACAFGALHPDLVTSGLRVYGISPQSTASHERFRSRHDLPFSLLADSDRSVTRAYGALGPFGLLVRRTTYLVGPDRRIVDAVRSDLRIAPHTELAERARKLASGGGATASPMDAAGDGAGDDASRA